MRRRHVRRQTWWLLIALAIMATLAVIVLSAPREVRRRRVEAAIARFQASPSRSTADKLGALLASGIPTNGQGGRILRLILSPTVMTRSAYPVNKMPSISVEWRFPHKSYHTDDTHFPDLTLKPYVQLEGQEKPTDEMINAGILAYQPLLLRCGARPLPIGTHRGQVYIDYTIIHVEWRAPVLMRLKSLLRARRLTGGTPREVRLYDAHFEIPLEIAVVEAVDAEQVALVSDPTLDEAVRQSFTRHYQDRYPLKGAPRPVAYKGLTALRWENVPIALAFEPVLRLPDGREILHLSRHVTGVGRFHTRAGGSDALGCGSFMTQFAEAPPGQYEATIVLRADPNTAYEDPAIKAIWGGTLEFPISFSVYAEPQRQ